MLKKEANIKSIVYKVISGITLIASIVLSVLLVINIKDMDVLPDKYLYISIGVLFILNIINIIFLLGKKIIFRVLGFIIAILICLGSIFGIVHTNKVTNIINNSFNNMKYETTTYSVVVLRDSTYNTLDDLKDKTMGYVNVDTNKDQFSNIINEKVSLNYREYENSYNMYDDLIAGTIDSIIVDDIYLEFIEDADEGVSDKIKTIYTFDIKEEVGSHKVDYTAELKPINVLITGSDARVYNKIQSRTRSDVNMIMTINPNTHEVLLTSIPRDYYVQLHGKSGLPDKLTHSGIYGLDMTKHTIEDFMGIKFDYVVKVGFGTVINVVDTIGGIDIDSDKAFKSSHIKDWYVEQGINHMDGQQALAYARERYAYATGDNHRVANQQQVLEAIFKKVMSDKSLLTNYEEVLNSLSTLYVTDIPSSYIKRLAKQQLTDMSSWKIARQQLSGEGKMGVETYSMPGWKLWVMIPYESSIKKNSNNIKDMMNGKTISELNL